MKSNPSEVAVKAFQRIFNSNVSCAVISLILFLFSPLDTALYPLAARLLKTKSSLIKESNKSALLRSRCHRVPRVRPHLAARRGATLRRHSVRQ